MEGYYVGLLKYVAVVADRSRLGCDLRPGNFLSRVSFRGASDIDLEGVGLGEGDTLGI